MKSLVSLAMALLIAFGCTYALAQSNAAQKVCAVNPDNYPYFYVMDIQKAETDGSPAIMIKGCFGDFKTSGIGEDADLEVPGFDEENPVELKLADTCKVLLPADFSDNIMVNLPCSDILQWFAAHNQGDIAPLTFYSVVTLDELSQVTKLEYQYSPWG